VSYEESLLKLRLLRDDQQQGSGVTYASSCYYCSAAVAWSNSSPLAFPCHNSMMTNTDQVHAAEVHLMPTVGNVTAGNHAFRLAEVDVGKQKHHTVATALTGLAMPAVKQ